MPEQAGGRHHEVRTRLWMYVGAAGLLWALLHGLGVVDPTGLLTKSLGAVLAVVATVLGIRWWRPEPVWPWRMVLAALGLFAVELTLRLFLVGPDKGVDAARPLVPDLLALAAYVVLAIGVAGVAGVGKGDRDDADAVLDAVIAALAVLALLWVFLVLPFLAQDNVSLTNEIVLVGYPVGSVFVFAMGARLMFGRGARTAPAMVLCLVAVLFLLIGDTTYALKDSAVLDVPSSLRDVPYFIALLAYSVAVLHPTMAQVGQRRRSDQMAPTRSRLLSVALALCVSNVVLFLGVGNSEGADRVALWVITTLMMVAAVVRMTRALSQHAASQKRLAYQATHDDLTGLPNRAFLVEHIQRALVEQQASVGTVSLLHLNLDRFGLVNDTMGHSVGDELLQAAGRRLVASVRQGDVVGRIGGDEFAVVVTGLESEARAKEFGERARMVFLEAFQVDGTDVPVTVSVGVAHHAAREAAAELLLRDADTAVSHARALGGDTVLLCNDAMRQRVAEDHRLERELRHARERGQLSLHYQPKIDLGDEVAIGMEALLRWDHPELGRVPPDRFIPIAEDTGMIVEIGAWVIDQACTDVARLRDEYSIHGVPVSVNVSARQLRSNSLVDTAIKSLVRHELSSDSLCVELTESVLMDNLVAASGQLGMLRTYGSRVSIDDFGTGYSSLAYLSSLPVDELKIDREFVKVLTTDPHAGEVIGAVVTLAKALDIRTVAEGTETRAEVDRLKALGCDEAQGYHFSRPVPFEELPTTLLHLGLRRRPPLRSVPAPELRYQTGG